MSILENQQEEPRQNRKLFIYIIGVVVFFAIIGLLLGALGLGPFGPPQLHGTVLQSPEPEADFTLTAHTGEQVSLGDFRGKTVLLYFGYTFCPDVCPTTLIRLAGVMKDIGRRSDDVQVLMITVDPERDTPEKLAKYVPNFDPNFIGLTGTEDEITAVTTLFGIYYEKVESESEIGYLVNHTASILVVDKEGYLRLIYAFDTPDEDIADDLRYLTR